MRSKKRVIISSLLLLLMGFGLIIWGYSKNSYNPFKIELIKNLGYGLFCSSAVTFGIGGTEYYTIKKETLKKYLSEANKLLRMFLKIEYFPYDTKEKLLIDYFYYKEINKTFPAYYEKEEEILNKLKQYYKELISSVDNDLIFDKIISEEYKHTIKNMNKVIRNYIKFVDDVSMFELDSHYYELSFLSKKGNHKYRDWILINLQLKFHTYFNEINNITKGLMNLPKDEKENYYRNSAILIDELQNKLYEIDTKNNLNIPAPEGKCISKIILSKYTNKLEENIEILHSKIWHCQPNKINPRYYIITSLSTKNDK